jgi:hypothetical protein
MMNVLVGAVERFDGGARGYTSLEVGLDFTTVLRRGFLTRARAAS